MTEESEIKGRIKETKKVTESGSQESDIQGSQRNAKK